jgi:hypothetical protein
MSDFLQIFSAFQHAALQAAFSTPPFQGGLSACQ